VTNRNLKRGLIVVGILFVIAIIVFPTLLGLLGSNEIVNHVSEPETIQTAIHAFMVDNDLDTVTPSTSGAGGETINRTGTQFHDTFNLLEFMDQPATRYCYRWWTDGRITHGYDVDADGNCAADTDQLYPRIR